VTLQQGGEIISKKDGGQRTFRATWNHSDGQDGFVSKDRSRRPSKSAVESELVSVGAGSDSGYFNGKRGMAFFRPARTVSGAQIV